MLRYSNRSWTTSLSATCWDRPGSMNRRSLISRDMVLMELLKTVEIDELVQVLDRRAPYGFRGVLKRILFDEVLINYAAFLSR